MATRRSAFFEVSKSGAALFLALLGACQAPLLERAPFAFARPGQLTLTARPALFTLYGIDGDFETMNFATGEPLLERDSGDVIGRLGAALRGDLWLSSAWMLSLGADYRKYDVEDLTPTEELDLSIETIDSLQYFVALRHLFPALDAAERLRWFGELSIAYLPSVDVGFEVDLSDFGASNLEIESEGEGFWVGGLATGLAYQLYDRWLVELGLQYELPLNSLDADLSFEIAGNRVPLQAELEPQGLVGYWGLTWVY